MNRIVLWYFLRAVSSWIHLIFLEKYVPLLRSLCSCAPDPAFVLFHIASLDNVVFLVCPRQIGSPSKVKSLKRLKPSSGMLHSPPT